MSGIESAISPSISSNAASVSAAQTESQADRESFLNSREDFLTIFLAQLKHQDPLEPMDSTEYIDSISRITHVEQSITQSGYLENIENILLSQDTNFGTPVSYLDKDIEFLSNTIRMENGEAKFSYNLDERPDQVNIIIRNSNGDIVRREDGVRDVGKNIINWDGKDNVGNPQLDGEYTVEVSAVVGFGEDAVFNDIPTSTRGIVTGANFEDGNVILLVGDIPTTVGDVTSIRSLQ